MIWSRRPLRVKKGRVGYHKEDVSMQIIIGKEKKRRPRKDEDDWTTSGTA